MEGHIEVTRSVIESDLPLQCTILNGTFEPHAKMAMPDIQLHPGNLHLNDNAEDVILFKV